MMSRISVRFSVSIVTFTIGVLLVIVWVKTHQALASEVPDDVIAPITLPVPVVPPETKPGQVPPGKGLTLTASTVLQEVVACKTRQPDISAVALADYGNKLLAKKGFNYSFDNCRLKGISRPGKQSYIARLKAVDGGSREARIINYQEFDGSLCAECFVELPATKMRADEMTLLVDGEPYRFSRSKDWVLDEVALVDETLRNTIRTWQLPFPTIPLGVSADGTKLYIDTGYDGNRLEDVVLELSATGEIQFQSREVITNLSPGEWLTDFPKDATNHYLSFLRFKFADSTYIIRFSGPCT